jgi:hypothetical protein
MSLIGKDLSQIPSLRGQDWSKPNIDLRKPGEDRVHHDAYRARKEAQFVSHHGSNVLDANTRWSEWKPDNDFLSAPLNTDSNWRSQEILNIQKRIITSRAAEEQLLQEMRNNERVLHHNMNELRHWKAAVQAREEELVKRHQDDCERMKSFLNHYKDRLQYERQKLKASLVKCVVTTRRVSEVLKECIACEYELVEEQVPTSFEDRLPEEPKIFEECLQSTEQVSLAHRILEGRMDVRAFISSSNVQDSRPNVISKSMDIARGRFTNLPLGASFSSVGSRVEVA